MRKKMETNLIGLTVPNFRANATSNKTFELQNVQGKFCLLYFYPKDNTPGCTNEAIQFREIYSEFNNANCVIFGISRDSLASHEKFKSKMLLPFELIEDANEEICNMFDVLKMKNLYGRQFLGIERSSFLINPDGILVKEWRKVKVPEHRKQVLDYLKHVIDF